MTMPDAAAAPTLADAATALETAVSRLEDVAEALAHRAAERGEAPETDGAAAAMAEAARRLDAVIARLQGVLEQE
jgi:division protein CdvB (Snf7/Vps24/ESCRT-III family)